MGFRQQFATFKRQLLLPQLLIPLVFGLFLCVVSKMFLKFLCVLSVSNIVRSRKKFSTTYAIVSFFFSRSFHENFKFLKNCPYDFHEFLHSHFTHKGAPACAKASKSYDWNVRNIAKISPKMAKISPKTAIFRLFSIFSKTVHTIRTKFSTVILHHIRVLYVQWHQNLMAWMWET